MRNEKNVDFLEVLYMEHNVQQETAEIEDVKGPEEVLSPTENKIGGILVQLKVEKVQVKMK